MSVPGIIGLNGMIPVPWREFIGFSPGCTSSSSFAFGGGTRSALNIDINFADTGVAVTALLGNAIAIPGASGSNATLSRSPLPAQHPEFTQLYAVSVPHVQGISFQGKLRGSGFGGGFYSVYRWRRLTVTYEAPRYAVLSDAQVGVFSNPELSRFVYPEFQFSSEALERQDGEYQYSEGPGNGKPVVSGVAQYLSKVGITLHWMNLPEIGLFDLNGNPTNILNCVNHVNSVAFFGRPAGTLLFDPPVLEPVASPYFFSMGTFPNAGRFWNAHINLKYFSPPPGTALGVQGWNSAPYPADGGRWAHIQSADASHQPLYPTTDFNNAFFMNALS